jgi:predicted RNA binding protein YcfA (HicA-like mRNA interferase family)
MPRLPSLSAREVCGILKKHGFVIVRQKGSHLILRKELPERGITVPVPNYSEIAKGTLKSIIDQSEIPKSEFQK